MIETRQLQQLHLLKVKFHSVGVCVVLSVLRSVTGLIFSVENENDKQKNNDILTTWFGMSKKRYILFWE